MQQLLNTIQFGSDSESGERHKIQLNADKPQPKMVANGMSGSNPYVSGPKSKEPSPRRLAPRPVEIASKDMAAGAKDT